MVPGHEIVGRVTRTGNKVTKFKAGDVVGVGCFVDSCRTCPSCQEGEEQFCEKHLVFTYNSTEMDGKTPTYGGYSNQMIVDENYLLRVPSTLPAAGAAGLALYNLSLVPEAGLEAFRAAAHAFRGVVPA